MAQSAPFVQAGPVLMTSPGADDAREATETIGGQERAFSSAADQFRALLESAPDAMVIVDSDGRIVLVNRQTELLFGYTREALVGQPVEMLLPEQFRAGHHHLRSGYFAAPDVRAMGAGRELLARRADGTEFPVEISLSPLDTETGTLVSAAVRDVTSRKRAEDQFRALLESAPDAMVIVDSDGRIVLVNRQTELLFGYTREALVGQPVEMLLPEQFRAGHHHLRSGYFAAPDVRAMGAGRELLARRADGTEFPVEISLSPLDTETGTLVSAAVRDVTSRKRAEDQFRDLAAIVESSDDAILVKTLDGTISEWNTGAERIYGYPAHEIVGQPVSILAAPDRHDEIPDILGRIARGERVEHFETVRMRRDGALIDVSIKVSAVRDARGQIVGASTVARDISEAKRAREDLAAAHRALSGHAEELERRNRHLVLVNGMSELLGSIDSEAEAYEIAGDYGAELFPGNAGSIFLSNPSGSLLEAVVSWGEAIPGETVFAPVDCWAVRRGRICGRPGVHNAPRCRHIHPSVDAYLCVPLTAQGRSIGVLHLIASPADDGPSPGFDQSAAALAATFMESLALALANFRLREMLQVQSIRDPLTGLFNRRYMEESLERELKRAARNHRPLGLLMVDVDHFKGWNDTYGHDAGDALIREIARLIEHHTRGEDIASRFGGDEFLLVLPEAPLETTIRRAHDLHRAVNGLEMRHLGRTLGKVSVTIGVAAHPEDGNNTTSLIRAADEALYAGKRAGRDRVEASRTLDLIETGITSVSRAPLPKAAEPPAA